MKKEQYATKKHNLYENGTFIDSLQSHEEDKKAKHRKPVEASKDTLDLYIVKIRIEYGRKI